MIKKILLVTPYIASIYDNGKLVAKALWELGYDVVLWDSKVISKPPSNNYDLALVIKGLDVDVTKLKRPRINWFPDHLWLFKGIDDFINQFDYFFTISKEKRGVFLPGANDPDVHKPYKTNPLFDVVYIGTANTPDKVKFIKKFMRTFKGKFGLFGNDWEKYGIKAYPPQYFYAFAQVCASSKIVLNLNDDMYGIGPTRKIHEVAGCGTAMMVIDNAEGQEETYPMVPSFNSFDECIELIDHYLEYRKERLLIVKQMQKSAYRDFTYKKQLENILKHL